MKLWLDDLRNPNDHGNPEAVWVKSAKDAISIIRGGNVEFISFDHDLGSELDGHDVAAEIELLVHEGRISMPTWAVHSANPVGEAEITAAMQSAERFSKVPIPAPPKKEPRTSKQHSFNQAARLPESHRALPASLDAEKGVLCSILLSPDNVLPLAVERINENQFHHPSHKTIFSVLVDLWKESKPIDLVTLTQALADRILLENVGGPGVLAELLGFLPTATNAEYYLDIVLEKSLLRRMITVCTSSAVRCYEEQGDVKLLIDDVEKEILAVSESRVREKIKRLKEHVNDAIDSIEELYKSKGQVTGVASGYKKLDEMTGGLHDSEMIVIAARPSMGKTALAMNMAENAAVDQKIPVGVFSLEMSASQLVLRLLCSRARVDLRQIRNGLLSKLDQQNLMKASSSLSQSEIIIDDTASLSILELRARARRMKEQFGIGLIVIDYLQLLKSPSKRSMENRQIEIAEISGGIKALAKELGIPVIVLAQLNREAEKRGGVPRISDLRESGSIEQDADIVGLLYRSAYYGNNDQEKPESEGESELIIAKHRNGATGAIPLTFLNQYTRFETRDTSHEEH